MIDLIQTLPFLLTIVGAIVMIVGFRLKLPSKSPIDVLAEIVANVVERHWEKRWASSQSPELNEAERIWVYTAMEYLSARESMIGKLEYKKAQEAFRRIRPSTADSEDESEPLSFIAQLLIAALLSFLGATALYAAVALVFYLPSILTALAQYSPYLVGVIALWYSMAKVLEIFLKRFEGLPDLVPVIGEFEFWSRHQPHTREKIQSERQRLHIMLSEREGDAIGTSAAADTLQDPDIRNAETTAVPAIPGIAELALSASHEAIEDIRSNLHHLRKFHTRIAFGTVGLFFVSVCATIAGTIFAQDNTYEVAFGGAGLGTVLGVFSYITLRNQRVAHISLALFESYIAELRANLSEVESLNDLRHRIVHRAECWKVFRRGLNDLWASERRRDRLMEDITAKEDSES